MIHKKQVLNEYYIFTALVEILKKKQITRMRAEFFTSG